MRGIGDIALKLRRGQNEENQSGQKADIVRRIQVKNPDGTWAVSYKAIAAEFGVSPCLISHIAKRAGLPQRERGPQHFPFAGKRYQPPAQLWDNVPGAAWQTGHGGGSPSHSGPHADKKN